MAIKRPENYGLYLFAHIASWSAILIVPWILVLNLALPNEMHVIHWRIIWIVFDSVLSVFLAATGIAALRNSSWVFSLAPATAAFLLCDVWFDIMTARRAGEFRFALFTAIIGEIPLAIICIVATIISRREYFNKDKYLRKISKSN